jgi:uncharacterized protein (TIGR03437 family)
VFLVLFGTGIRFRTDLGAVVAQIGGTGATVLYAGLAPGFTGLDQLNLPIARTLIGRGEVDVGITVNSRAANTVRVAIK